MASKSKISTKKSARAKDQFSVHGQVQQFDGRAFAYVLVRAVDKDMYGKENLLGETRTDKEGIYKISFSEEQFRKSDKEKGGPDLIIRILDAKGRVIASAKKANAKNEETIDVVMKENGELPSEEFRVYGKITRSQKPVAGVLVEAYDRDLRREQRLGECMTNDDGAYEIFYHKNSFIQSDAGNADVFIKVVSTQKEVLAVSSVVFNAEPVQKINLPLSADERTDSLWEQLNKDLLPLLQGQKQSLTGKSASYTNLPPAELLPADIEFLTKDTGRKEEQIRKWVLAYKSEIETGSIPAEAFYAWYDQALPEELFLLWQVGTDGLIASLQEAIANNIIPEKKQTWFGDLQQKIKNLFVASKLDPAPDGARASLGDILNTLGNDWIKTEQRHQLAFIADRLDPDAEDFNTNLEKVDLPADQKLKLRNTLRLAKITSHHPGVMKDLQPWLDNGHSDILQGLATIQTDQWIDLAYTHGHSPGTYIEPEAYALGMRKNVEERYPSACLAQQIKAGTVLAGHEVAKKISSVLVENPDFNIAKDDVQEFAKKAKLQEKESGMLQHIQNLKQLGSDFDTADTLIQYGLTSAAKIIEYTPLQIQRIIGDELALEEITAIHGQANNAQVLGIGMLAYLQPVLYGTYDAHVMKQEPATSSHPTLRKLFGSSGQCACTPCRSVLSPAAYYADLLKFVDVSGPAGIALQKKRPDLFDLELSCENAEIELPYIDLCLEILENTIALPKIITLPSSVDPEFQLNNNQIGVELKNALQETAEDEIGPLYVQKDNNSIRPITAIPGIHYWIVKDAYRRWSVAFQKQSFGTAIDIANGSGMNVNSLDINAFVGWMNRNITEQSLPSEFKIPFEQVLLKQAKDQFPVSIISYTVTTKESSKRWSVSFTTGTKVSITLGEHGRRTITKESKDGATKLINTYHERTAEATASSLDRGEIKGALLQKKIKGKQTVTKTADAWLITGHHKIEVLYLKQQLTIEGLSYQSTASDQNLLVKPQNKNPLAYQEMSSSAANFPWSLPYDQALTEIRSLLKKIDLPLSVLRQLSLPYAQANNDFRRALEQLNITPAQAAIVARPLSGDALWNAWGFSRENGAYAIYDHYEDKEIRSANAIELLRQASVVIYQAGITFLQLQELLNTSEFINPGRAIIIQYDKECDLTKTTLNNLADESFFDRLHRFVRLWKTINWRADDLDKLLSPSGSGLSDNSVFIRIANCTALVERLKISFERLSQYFNVFENKKRIIFTQGSLLEKRSFFDEVFQDKLLQNPPNPDFEFTKFQGTNGRHEKALNVLLPYIASSLGVKAGDLDLLLHSALPDFQGTPSPDIMLLHNLWRHVELMTLLDLSAEDYVHAHTLISSDVSVFSSYLTLLDFTNEVSFLQRNKIDIFSLRTLLTSYGISSIVDNSRILNALKDLQQRLRAILHQADQTLASINKRRSDVLVQLLSKEIALDTASVTALISNKLSVSSTTVISALDYFIGDFLAGSTSITAQGLETTEAYKLLIKLVKTRLLNTSWKARASELKWLREPNRPMGYTGIVVNNLPTSVHDTHTISYFDWKKTTLLYSISEQSIEVKDLLNDYLDQLGEGTTRVQLNNARRVIANYFGLPLDEVNNGAINQLMDTAADISATPQNPPPSQFTIAQFDPLKLARLFTYLEVLKKWGLKGHHIQMLLTPATSESITLARGMLKQKFNHDHQEVLQQINNQLRIEQRDRLVDYLCWRDNLADANRLYERYLIDVKMQPCMRTTRLIQSTAAAQLFVHRSLMNLEAGVSPESFDQQRWEWMQNYRVWEANRKVFLYPENWLYPELRDDKTDIFKAFETHLHQNQINESTATAGLRQYISSLAEQSRVIVLGMHEYKKTISKSGPTSFLFQIGRTINSPYSFYWREGKNYCKKGASWTGWNKIDQDLSADHIVPFSYQGEIYLGWPTINKTKESENEYYEVGLSWLKKTVIGWTESKTSVDKIKIEALQNRDERSMFLCRLAENPALKDQINIELYIANPVRNTWYPSTNLEHVFQSDYRENQTNVILHFNTYIRYISSGRIVKAAFGELYFEKLLHGGKPNYYFPGNEGDWSPAYQSGTINFDVEIANNSSHVLKVAAQRNPIEGHSEKWITIIGGKASVFSWNVVFDFPEDPEPQVHSENEPVSMLLKGTFSLFRDQDGTWQENLQTSPAELIPPVNSYFYSSGIKEVTSAPSKIELQNRIQVSSKSSVENFVCVRASKSPSLLTNSLRTWQVEEGSNKFLVQVDESMPGSTNNHIVQLSGYPDVNEIKNHLSIEVRSLYELQLTPDFEENSFGKNQVQASYDHINIPNTQLLPFNLGMPNAIYNWEVFYHIPIMAATYLSSQHRFAEARKWFHFVFDPTTNDATPGNERFWKFLPFRTNTQHDSIQKLLDTLASPNAPTNDKEDIQDQVNAWLDDPFNPFAVARMRISAYQWHTITSYIKNLIEWGDQLFRRDTRESINEATMLYVMAYNLLGPRPEQLRKTDASVLNMSYREIGQLDDFSNRWVTLLDTPFGKAWLAFLVQLAKIGFNPNAPNDLIKQLSSVGSAYFCVPKNEKTIALWDTVDDRLFKIRNCRNIDGVVRNLPLLDPPIDPELLIRAKAKGLSIQEALDGLYAPPPLYRFNILLQKAMEICNEVKSLGSALLSAIEKKEAEHLTLMRSGQEMDMQKLITSIREEQIKETTANIHALRKSRENIVARIVYLQRQMGNDQITYDAEGIPVLDQTYIAQPLQKVDPLAADFAGLGLIKSEEDQILWMQTNNILNLIAGGFHGGGGISHIVAAGFGAEPTGTGYRVATGIAHGSSAFGTLFNTLASHYAMHEKRSGQMAGWQRRRDEWLYQAKTAITEIHQLDKQIIASEIRMSIAQKELDNHKKQIEHTKELDDYVRNQKFSKEALYTWMQTRLSDVYFSAYKLALDQAKVAQRAFEFELGVENTTFIKPAYWDSLQKGLLAGESLSHDLHRMEMSYLDKNKREYEITKHISLKQLSPLAILQLRQTGICDFNIPEVLFDMDYAGQYFRRIKSVSISIPCIAGPYTSVSSKLTLKDSRYRKDTSAISDEDARFQIDDRRQSIAASAAQNDSGVFELNFRDERYLPFEGRGVISSWEIELPKTFRQFDYNTISDAIIHLKYTSRESTDNDFKRDVAAALQGRINNILQGITTGLHILINLKHDMPNEWNLLKQGSADVKISKSRLPYFAQSSSVTIREIMLISTSALSTITIKIANKAAASLTFSAIGATGLYSAQLPVILLNESFMLSGDSTVLKNLDELVLIVKFIV